VEHKVEGTEIFMVYTWSFSYLKTVGLLRKGNFESHYNLRYVFTKKY